MGRKRMHEFSKTIVAWLWLLTAVCFFSSPSVAHSQTENQDWGQWRGPSRDGITSLTLPDSIQNDQLKETWSVPLSPGYSGPLLVGDLVYVTETVDKKFETVRALSRTDGQKVWSAKWEGSMRVPFFAAANGSWIRSTPAYDNGKLYVAGMRDVIVCLDAKKGDEIWKVDFPAQTRSKLPTFGFVCSPLVLSLIHI